MFVHLQVYMVHDSHLQASEIQAQLVTVANARAQPLLVKVKLTRRHPFVKKCNCS